MKQIKLLGLAACSLSLVACGDIKNKEKIAQMSPTEVAELACNAYKNIELEQLQPLFPEKSYKRLISKSSKNADKFSEFVKDADCGVTKTEGITYKRLDATRVSFEKFSAIKVFKVDGQYQVAIEG
ncbi:MAG: hypothetical protein ACPGTQ_09800 [Colwellia sp.]